MVKKEKLARLRRRLPRLEVEDYNLLGPAHGLDYAQRPVNVVYSLLTKFTLPISPFSRLIVRSSGHRSMSTP